MDSKIENEIWEGKFPDNLKRVISYYEMYKTLNPREMDIYSGYLQFTQALEGSHKRFAFARLINCCVALDSLPRWAEHKTAFPNDIRT